tara:strand:+ start:13799 stop:14269 length:471 start_codon:yes stop_codon:yes gene_type:complete
MNKHIFIIVYCLLFFYSCNFFEKKELPKDKVIDTIVDFNSVDVFPLFPLCDSLISEEKQKICSQIKLSEHIYASLVASNIMVTKKVNDTILVKLKVDNNGEVSLVKLEASTFIQLQIPTIDSLILAGINNLPILKPAIKRGIPVATEFTLPIILIN